MPQESLNFMALARKRFSLAKDAWSEVRNAYSDDSRFVNVKGGQWDKAVKTAREEQGDPALEFNELHTYVQQLVNRTRMNRPQPKVQPSDDQASEQTAQFWGHRLRYIQYASQAGVAYDTATECAATGGWGFCGITTEYVDTGGGSGRPSFNQEPRIKRILDPLTEYPDPSVQEPDFSDAKWWFSRQWVDREAFRRMFPGKEPVDFDSESNPDWTKEEQVCIAQYWVVEERQREYVRLAGGVEGWRDEMPTDVEPMASRSYTDRKVTCYLIDGEKVLEKTDWLGSWIPRIPVLGREVVVDGKRHFISIIRFARDAQRLKNVYKSNIAGTIQLSSKAPWLGAKGQFKDHKWSDANRKNYAFLEYEPVAIGGQPAPPPSRNTAEAPIAALTSAAMQEMDDIKRAVGYSDALVNPSQQQLSGVALQRRAQQQDLTNFHFEDNLIRSQWHCARVVLELDMKLADTPRVLRGRKEDGSTLAEPVTLQSQGAPAVPGFEGQVHHRIDVGQYGIVVESGPGYATKRDEERDVLLQSLQANPGAWAVYADLVFKIMGYPELEERAKLALPPPIQQAISQQQQGIPPQAQAMIAALNIQKQQLMAFVQKLMQVLQGKQTEAKGKLDVAKLQVIGQMMLKQMEISHDAGVQVLHEQGAAIANMLDMVTQSELAPDPNAPPQGGPVQ